jgi:hypothetical protein
LRSLIEARSVAFLKRLHEAAPMTITKALTDNGSQFTDRFTSKAREPWGQHHFDVRCKAVGSRHRPKLRSRVSWLGRRP